MSAGRAEGAFATHEVTNQPPPLVDYNLFTSDAALQDALAREGGAPFAEEVSRYGEALGRAETIEQGALANRYPPVLRSFDRYGNRRDEVEFHPAYHALMRMAVSQGLHAGPWADPKPGAHVARAASVMLHIQIEAGTECPVTMTYAAVPVIRRAAGIAEAWLPKIFSRTYDPRFMPVAGKSGATIGMGMTEKQGGSDVRANSTRAEPLSDGSYRLIGHKWFFSAPMCDAFLVLAYMPEGLSCFFVPRWLPDGTQNPLRLQRLKDKLGNRSNASSEVEFQNAVGWLLGEPGRGVATIIEMATYTRLDCVLGNAGLMRQALAQALHHAHCRMAFQRRLDEQPLMTNVLADLAIESEAATALALRLARAFDRPENENENENENDTEAAFRRVVTPAAKYWICKRGAAFAAEAMEVLGGNGYVEEAPLARIYREMPLGSIWEGSGNIMCLDVLRALQRSPAAFDAILEDIAAARGADRRLDAFAAEFGAYRAQAADEYEARRFASALVLAVQGALLVRFAPAAVADAFCATRLAADAPAGVYGMLPGGVDVGTIIERARPRLT